MSIPLKDRKIIKEAVAAFQGKLKEAGDLVGVELKWDDQSAEWYTASAAANAKVELLVSMPMYGKCLVAVFTEVGKDDIGKKAIQDLMATRKVEFIIRTGDFYIRDYFIWTDTALQIEVKAEGCGWWEGYYSVENFIKDAKTAVCHMDGHTFALKHKKNYLENKPKIEAAVKKASAAYGADLTWNPDYTKLRDWMMECQDPANDKENVMGNQITSYVEFLVEEFITFIKNPDNKEAIEEKLNDSKRLGFVYWPENKSGDVTWAWGDDGALCLGVKGKCFGYWITSSYYSQAGLEATL